MATAAANELLRRALALARFQRSVRLAVGLLVAGLVLAIGLAALLTSAGLAGPMWLRFGVIVATCLAVGIVTICVVGQASRSPSPALVAAIVERRFPELSDRFVTAVEIAWSKTESPSSWSAAGTCSPALANALARQAQEATRGMDLRAAIDTGPVRRLGLAAAVAATALFISALVFHQAWSSLLAPPSPTTGTPAPVLMRPLLQPSAAGPSIADLKLQLDSPAYTGRPSETRQTDLGSVSALVGTRVTLSARATGDHPVAELTLNESSESLTIARNGSVSRQFVLRTDMTWRLRVEDRSGSSMSTPVCRIKAVRDQPPTIVLTEPGKDLALPRPRPVRLAYRAEDDWGVSSIVLQYRVSDGKAWQSAPVSVTGGRSASGAMDWDLTPLRLTAGQSVAYRMAARDNDSVSGPKTGRSPTYTVTIGGHAPSSTGTGRAQEAVAEEAEGLEELEEQAEELGRQLEELIGALEKDATSAEERARRSAELAEAKRRVAEYADRVSRAFAESEREASADREVPPEIREKLAELHDLLQEAMNQDLQRALDQMEEALKNLSPEDLRETLSQARKAQQDFVARLQQAMELLKRLRLQQEISRVADQAERLAQEQHALNEQRAGQQPQQAQASREQADKQQALEKREAALEGDLERLGEQAREIDQAAGKEIGEVAQDLRRSGAQQAMQEAADRLRQGQTSAAAQPQNQALAALNQAATALRQLQAQMTANNGQKLSKAAQEMTRDALYLSHEQEQVMQSAADLNALTARSAAEGKSQRENLRRTQETLESGTRQLGERIRELARQTPVVDPSLAERAANVADTMAQAARETAAGAGPQAAASQRQAMSELNQLAEELIRLNENMQQAAQGMAMQQLMQQMQALAQQQRGLNQQTEQRADQGSQPRRQGSASDLADEQRRIKEALERLLQRAGKPSGLPDQLGDVPAQMEDVEQQLTEDRLGRQTLEQQRDILHRMLDAQRSVYKKDEQRRRRTAERPKPFRLPASPPELRPRRAPPAGPTLTTGGDEPLPLDYEDIVREYFRALAEMP